MSGKPFPDSVVTEAEVSMLLLNFLQTKGFFRTAHSFRR